MTDSRHEPTLLSRTEFDRDRYSERVKQLRHEEIVGALSRLADTLDNIDNAMNAQGVRVVQ